MAQSVEFAYSKSNFELKTPSFQESTINSKFDTELKRKWDCAVRLGYFRYTLNDLPTKIISGHLRYVAQLNLQRGADRRKPQEMLSVAQPFNSKQFNFTKIKPHEVLMELGPNKAKCIQTNDEKTNPSIEIEHSRNNKIQSTVLNEEEKFPEELATKRQRTSSKHKVIINVSPLEYCNVLLVPNLQSCLPQVLTQEAIQCAVEMLMLSCNRGFRVGWNSLCGFASVNHLHFHAYYLQHELKIETNPTQLVHGPCHELIDWPARGFIFQLNDTDVDSLASDVFKVAHHLHTLEIAHNLFITRGTTLGSQITSETIAIKTREETVRLILWPRKSAFGAKTDAVPIFNVAVCELAGHLPIYSEEGYAGMTEEKARTQVSAVSLSQQEFQTLKEDIKTLL